MSVMPCARAGCESVMCDRLSYIHGYICDDCFSELVACPALTDVKEFMATPKRTTYDGAWAVLIDQEFSRT